MHYYRITCSNDAGVMVYYMATTRVINKRFVPGTLHRILDAGIFDIDHIESISREEYIAKLSKEGLPED